MKKGLRKERREDDVIINVGKNIAKYRKLKGLSQRMLATLCIMENSMISLYERGFVEPSISTLSIISKSLGIKLVQLFEDYTE